MMKTNYQIVILAVFLHASLIGVCQNVNIKSNEKEIILNPQIYPEFPGGIDSFMSYISKRAIYPNGLEEYQGKVYVQVIIDKDGKISEPIVLNGLERKLDSIAIEIIKNMPNWRPAINDGKAVKTKYSIPIKFSYNKNEKN